SRRVSTILSRPKATRLIKVENLFRASTDVTLSTGMRTSNQGAQARIYAGAQSADLLKCTLEQVRHCCLRQPRSPIRRRDSYCLQLHLLPRRATMLLIPV